MVDSAANGNGTANFILDSYAQYASEPIPDSEHVYQEDLYLMAAQSGISKAAGILAARGYENTAEAWDKYSQATDVFDGTVMAGLFTLIERADAIKTTITSNPLLGSDCSFSGNTLVSTGEGFLPINQVEVGDYVLAYDEETREIVYYPVTATWVHIDPVIVRLTIDGETIETTPNHPFYTSENRWVYAGSLAIGDEIRDAAWSTGTVETTPFVSYSQPMYNLTVDIAHTYFVGEGQWLVHNVCINDVPTLGRPGNNKGNRVVTGTLSDAEQMFGELTVGATSFTTYPNGAIRATMPDGSYVTFRAVGSAQSRFVPTINVDSPDIGYWGIKFEP